MAINITENITTREGISLTSSYMRLESRLSVSGDRVSVEAYKYVSKDAFKDGCKPITKGKGFSFEYDRDSHGTDILDFATDKVIEELTTDKTIGNVVEKALYKSSELEKVDI